MPNTSEDIRSFIAIEIPEDAKLFLNSIAAELKKTDADVKWVRTEGIHLTLKFLGSVRPDLIPELEKTLRPLFGNQPRFDVQIGGVGAFPNLGKPRVIWAGLVDPSGSLGPLAMQVERVVEPLGFPREKRPFNPHLTLGRSRSGRGAADLAEMIRQKMHVAGPRFSADHAVLFQSILRPVGAEYRPLCTFAFAKV